MKTLLALLILIPCLSFSETAQVEIEDTFYSSADCIKVKKNHFNCNKEGLSFYGNFINGYQDGLGVYKQVYENTEFLFVANHKNGKSTGLGKIIIKLMDDWSRELIFELNNFDYPLDLYSENSLQGVFYDTRFNYLMHGVFVTPNIFSSDNFYVFEYYDVQGYYGYEDLPAMTISEAALGCVYIAKLNLDSINKYILTPADGLATIGCIDLEKSDLSENELFGNRYIGYIKNQIPHGKGFNELDYSQQRSPDTLDIPPLEYFKNLDDPNKYEIGDFEEGILVSKNLDFLENSDEYIEFDKKLFSLSFNAFIGADMFEEFNSEYFEVLNDIDGYIKSFD